MVLPAVLRDPARHSEQAPRRRRHVQLDRDSCLLALARYLTRALRKLPAIVPAVLLGLPRRLHRARLAGLEAGRGRLRHRGPHPDLLLLRALPDHSAAARPVREAAAAAVLDRGS